MGYVLTTPVLHDGPSNPLYKTVSVQLGAWFSNYFTNPLLLLVPLANPIFALLAILLARKPLAAFICSAICIGSIIGTVGVSMFPFILPSSTYPDHSLMVWDSSSSQLTLFIMLIATVVFLPLVLAYTAWVYRVLRGKINEDVISNSDHVY